jgi:hypothetical protein
MKKTKFIRCFYLPNLLGPWHGRLSVEHGLISYFGGVATCGTQTPFKPIRRILI